MNRDVKYIGMDVHKEAIVIAVLDDGKLVMESIITIKSGFATGAGIAAELRGEQRRQNQKHTAPSSFTARFR